MLAQGRANFLPHWVKYKINAFSSCIFRGRHKIAITRYKNHLGNLSLLRHRRNIQAYFHINAFLHDIRNEAMLAQLIDAYLAPK